MTDGPTDQPASAEASGEPVPFGVHSRHVCPHGGRREERLRDERDADRRHGARWAVRRDPGDRRRLGDGEPDAEPRQGVRLAGRPDDDEVRVVLAEWEESLARELGVCLVEGDEWRLAAVGDGILRQPVEEALDRSRWLGRAGRIVRIAEPDDLGRAGSRSDRRGVDRPALLGRAARHEGRTCAALFRDDPVHRVTRRRDDGLAAGREEGLADEVEDLVRPGADEQLVGSDAIGRRGRLDEPAVVGRRIFREGTLEPACGEQPRRELGRRGRGVQIEPDDRVDRQAVASRDLLVGRFPAVRGRLVRRGERDRGGTHRSFGAGAADARRRSSAAR